MINYNILKRRIVSRFRENLLLRKMFRKKLRVLSYTCLIVGAYLVYSEVYMTMMMLETVGRTGLVVHKSNAKIRNKSSSLFSSSLGGIGNDDKRKENVRRLLHEMQDDMEGQFNFDAAITAFKLERHLRLEMKVIKEIYPV